MPLSKTGAPVRRHPRARHKAKAHEIPRTYRTSGHRNEKNKTNIRPLTKGTIMKNNTLDQILNSNLASVDPGFYQFALAKASSDLFKRIINK